MLELLNEWGPIAAIATLLWRWTVNMGTRLDCPQSQVRGMDRRLARVECLIKGSGLFHSADTPASVGN